MLYDKKWDSQVKSVEPSLQGMIAWLETKDPKEEYCYIDENCAMAQYLQAIGQPKRCCLRGVIAEMLNISVASADCFRNHKSKNFGELLTHLRRLDNQPS